MWIITVHFKKNVQMFEFETQEEAKAAFQQLEGNKYLSHVIYFNDFDIIESHL
ncbi:hypothetical protein [Bacillus sp. S/N-304-OC-R1]|uniref:hypothetical protein n=1 Tax=Bacillus sp. S/N-304-OC-R1 TaxID=2758034 RepID=UPI001C8DA5A0|nr:hypothetical protein [Bacillus sp. S/N-304-OC-R1]MBY0121495.1 hypothetical protein [Bacillus sp. S/N-304-OC-R1]